MTVIASYNSCSSQALVPRGMCLSL